ncbi:MAG: acyl-CoA dehydrogenase family protein, partial [bacterium]
HHLGVAAIVDYGSEEQKQKWLPGMCDGSCVCGLAVTEPGGGSDVAGLKTEAVLDGDTWTINGRKCFITNSHCAGVTVVTCRTGEDEKGRPILSTIAIEAGTEGFKPGREENKMGLKGSYTGELIMDNVKVPVSNTVGAPGKGMPITMKELGEVGRASMAAIELGILRACLEDAVAFAKERILYGKPLSKLQAIQFHIAEIRCD